MAIVGSDPTGPSHFRNRVTSPIRRRRRHLYLPFLVASSSSLCPSPRSCNDATRGPQPAISLSLSNETPGSDRSGLPVDSVSSNTNTKQQDKSLLLLFPAKSMERWRERDRPNTIRHTSKSGWISGYNIRWKSFLVRLDWKWVRSERERGIELTMRTVRWARSLFFFSLVVDRVDFWLICLVKLYRNLISVVGWTELEDVRYRHISGIGWFIVPPFEFSLFFILNIRVILDSFNWLRKIVFTLYPVDWTGFRWISVWWPKMNCTLRKITPRSWRNEIYQNYFDQIHYMDLFYGIILANVLMQIFYRNQELFFYANIRKASSKQELKIFCLLIIKTNFSIQYLQFIFS